jgi:tetratricopeptide (TPR) repeat protein
MRAYVFTDASLKRYAGQFVWLSVDTENPANTGFLKKYPINVWPTLLVVDPKKESVVLRYAGGATVQQLTKLLNDGAKIAKGAKSKADQAIALADKLAGEQKYADAAKAYDEAIAAAPKDWSRLGRAAESLTFVLTLARDQAQCAKRALELYPRVRGTYASFNVASNGLSCASGLAEKGEMFATLEKYTRETLANPKIPLSADDRSGLYETLIGAREAVKDEEGAHKLHEQRAAFLEAEAAKAKTVEQRAVFDSHRLTEYLALKQPEKAVEMLLQSEKDLPEDYNPPARLALAYRALGKYDDALAASDRAMKLVYGPRKIGVMRTRADIYTAMGNKEAARKVVEDAIAYAEGLPEEQRSAGTIASLKKKLETM